MQKYKNKMKPAAMPTMNLAASMTYFLGAGKALTRAYNENPRTLSRPEMQQSQRTVLNRLPSQPKIGDENNCAIGLAATIQPRNFLSPLESI